MATPDNRIRFPTSKVDFDDDVGTTGQDHDNYPAPGQQPRYDWMRLFLIGLLSQQSSYSEPSQFREGTPWFDLNDGILKIRKDDEWVSIADAISLGVDSDGAMVTLAGVYESIKTMLGYKPTASFSGHSSQDNVNTIAIPESLRAAAGAGSRPFVWVDGVMLDPRGCEYVGGTSPVSIRLTETSIDADQRFTVIMMAMDSAMFVTADVIL